MNGLILHCGAQHIDRAAMRNLPMPVPKGPRHHPIHHLDFVEAIDETVKMFGLDVTEEAFGVNDNGARFFGVMQLKGDKLPSESDYGVALGLRGSHDQTLPRGLSIGSRVFVCDNLSFAGEHVMNTKHTTNILDRLPEMLYMMVGKVINAAQAQHEQLESYKATFLPDSVADAAMTQLVRIGAINPTDLPHLIKEWDEPSHEEFSDPTVWRLFNAATETLKPRGGQARLATLQPRTMKLHNVCDELVLS